MSAGRGFLFEHPYTASSWHTTELAELKQEQNVYEVRVDMCAFGLVTKEGVPALKPTLLSTNIESLANALGRRCNGKHPQHQPLREDVLPQLQYTLNSLLIASLGL